MKHSLMLALLFLISAISVQSNAQFIPYQYPLKTYFDPNSDKVYMTGYTTQGQLFTSKYISGTSDWAANYSNPSAIGSSNTQDDRGMDIEVDSLNNIFVVGYVTGTLGKDIILLKYDSAGTLLNEVTIDYAGMDDVGLSLAIDADYIYIAGYVTNGADSTANMYVMKYDKDLDEAWTNPHVYEDAEYTGNDIATTILVDANFAYITGYSYRGSSYLNDVVRIVYDKHTGEKAPDFLDIHEVANSNERPVDYIITYDRSSEEPIRKSITTNVCIQDNARSQNPNYDYLTIRYDFNMQQGIEWTVRKDYGSSYNNIPTAVVADIDRDVYVTGYAYSPTYGYDFLTVKYDSDGDEVWSSATQLAGNQQPTSIVVDSTDVRVTGYSSTGTNQYLQETYSRSAGDNNLSGITSYYTPQFLAQNPQLEGAAFSGIDKEGNLTTIYAGWNGTKQYYAFNKQSKDGKIIYSTESSMQAGTDNAGTPGNYTLGQNYPNPFNPVTSIRFSLPKEGFVSLAVYDASGRKVTDLVRGYKQQGTHNVSFDGSRYASGVYFYRLQVEGFTKTNKMLLVK